MLIRTDILQPWRGEPLGGIKHPANIESLWTAPELAAVGLVAEIPGAIPDGHRRAGPSTWDANGQETIPTEPAPPPKETGAVDTPIFWVLFDYENRLGKLEGKPQVSAADFRAELKARV